MKEATVKVVIDTERLFASLTRLKNWREEADLRARIAEIRERASRRLR